MLFDEGEGFPSVHLQLSPEQLHGHTPALVKFRPGRFGGDYAILSPWALGSCYIANFGSNFSSLRPYQTLS